MLHSKQELIHFTKFVDSEKKTAKSYGIVDGKLVKAAFGNFFKGSFETASIPYGDLPDYIGAMVPGEFIVQGIHQTLASGSCPGDATRAKALFPFSERAGVLVIDTDSIDKFTGIDSLDDLISALNTIEPALTPAMKYCASSASSYIEYAGINSGLRGVHTYI
ncbi:MAG: hypothetical protein NTX38_12625, partial [Methylobacter sp.]|nr:hypothetical protein [Methylobacter sp.]